MSNIYHIVLGDLFTEMHKIGNPDVCRIIPHIVNDAGKYGKGFAESTRKYIPEAENIYRFAFREKTVGMFVSGNMEGIVNLSSHSFGLGRTIACKLTYNDKLVYLLHMIAQNGIVDELLNPKPIKYAALIKCMESIKTVAINNKAEIHAPKFGSGNAGGTWEFIEELIYEIWVEAGIPVYIYSPVHLDRPSFRN